MHLREVTLSLAVFVHGASLVARADTTNNDSLACGPNAVLLFLEICGSRSTTYTPDEIVCGPNGASMLQLKESCLRHGEEVQIRHFNQTIARNMPVPAIWQVNSKTRHHFVVVYRLSNSYAYALDGTTGRKMRIPWRNVRNYFTGNAVVRYRNVSERTLDSLYKIANSYWMTVALIVALVSLLPALPKAGRRNNLAAGTSRHTRRILVLLILCGLQPSMAKCACASSAASQLEWRAAEYGPLNALFFTLRVRGYEEQYANTLAKYSNSPPVSAADLVRIAQKLGYQYEIRRVSPENLRQLKMPFIIHLDGSSPSKGEFYVVLERHVSRCTVFNGAAATVGEMDNENLLRRWSGTVVVQESGSHVERVLALVCGVAVGGVLVLVVRVFQWRATHAKP